MMLRSLLIGVNGSEWSRAACDLGFEWARMLKIPVTLIGIVDVAELTAAEPVPMGASAFKVDRDARAVAAAHQRVNDALHASAQRADELGIECHVKAVDGHPAKVLGEEVQRHDLLLVGRRATPGSDRDPPPSTTLTEILRHVSRPVVVVGRQVADASAVVVAYDGSAQASRTLKSFVTSGMFYGHPIHLVGVSDEPTKMQDVLMRAMDYLAIHGKKAEIHVLPVGRSVAETLADFSRNLPACLLVMGVYGQPRLKELLFGSLTSSLLARSPAPLFLDH